MSYENLSNEELVSLAKKGNALVVNTLIARFEPAIEIKANKYCTKYWIKDELIQRGRIVLSNAINKYDLNHQTKSKFATYLNTCLENEFKTAINELNKKNGKYIGSDIFDLIEDDKNYLMSDARYNPEQIAINNETEQEIKSVATEILSNIERNVYNLKNVGYKNSEISKELKIDKKSVENALTRIKQKLHKKLKNNNNE